MRICYLAIAVSALFVCASVAPAAPPKKSAKHHKAAKTTVQKRVVGRPSNAENGLVGVHLYDSGLVLLNKFGSPDDIQGLSFGGASVGPGGGGAGPGGVGRPGAGPSGPGGAPMSGPRGAGPSNTASPGGGPPGLDQITDSENDDALFIAPPSGGIQGSGGLGSGGSPPAGAGGQRAGGPPQGVGSGPSSGPPSMSGGNQGTSGRTVFTRWIYKRDGGQYSFIIDKFNHVVEIEAIGLHNPKVRTKKGIGFGANFAAVIRRYGAPDAYEINQSTIVLRYLVRDKVAFRLNRLGPDKPHVVTGVVVAAGKS